MHIFNHTPRHCSLVLLYSYSPLHPQFPYKSEDQLVRKYHHRSPNQLSWRAQAVLFVMSKNTAAVVCLLIIVMDVVAGILGIEAEIAENKVKNLRMWIFECKDPSYQAFKLGLAASVLLALAHVIANLLGGCVCVWSREDWDKATANKQFAVVSFVFSWIILAIAFAMLMMGTMSNSSSRKNCGIAHHRLLSIGGILCFIHGLFTIAYYVSATAITRQGSGQHV